MPSAASCVQVIHVTLQWEGLTYSVPVGRRRRRTQKTILQGVSGHVLPGHLLAVMGPTGEQRREQGAGAGSGCGGEGGGTEGHRGTTAACGTRVLTAQHRLLTSRAGAAGMLPRRCSRHCQPPCQLCARALNPAGPCPCHALASGSGKTSLINALAGRLPKGGSLTGQVLVNGTPRGRGFRGITCYVLQVRCVKGRVGEQAGKGRAWWCCWWW